MARKRRRVGYTVRGSVEKGWTRRKRGGGTFKQYGEKINLKIKLTFSTNY